ncbi:hypothetical protein R9C00_24190 [Flammeovirgaceae bacterium SG7u.111]|nr:hypothetical protein [Flammeovirgaceae bacterium SG7u.132]WPO34802.1 hypothetical protein R9C00_24190 [Flammeovirgaceae bacterium SG7u.111]
MKLKLIFILAIGLLVGNVAMAQVPFPSEQDSTKEGVTEEDVRRTSNKPPLKDRIYIGGNLGLSFGTITYIDVSPLVGYRITPEFSAGAGFSYRYYEDNRYNSGYNIVGPRAFARYVIADMFFPYVEYESLYVKFDNSDTKTWYDALFLGAGLMQPVGKKGRIMLTALYNVNYSQTHSLYSSPWQYRVGFVF